ncbi:MAG: hypothetical protein KC486_12570, partial [Myxococcales bacterium]|nr:hypothetical protein [Myxococcales bacterium]
MRSPHKTLLSNAFGLAALVAGALFVSPGCHFDPHGNGSASDGEDDDPNPDDPNHPCFVEYGQCIDADIAVEICEDILLQCKGLDESESGDPPPPCDDPDQDGCQPPPPCDDPNIPDCEPPPPPDCFAEFDQCLMEGLPPELCEEILWKCEEPPPC